MPDITMCANSNCRARRLCYRYTAIPSRRQSYSVFHPEFCPNFIDSSGLHVRDCDQVDHEWNTTKFLIEGDGRDV
jgi:hypothetical protein